jgi:hypothetical protein
MSKFIASVILGMVLTPSVYAPTTPGRTSARLNAHNARTIET